MSRRAANELARQNARALRGGTRVDPSGLTLDQLVTGPRAVRQAFVAGAAPVPAADAPGDNVLLADPRVALATALNHGAGTRDLRTEPRKSVDQVWSTVPSVTMMRFGRSPSCEVSEQATPGLAMLLTAALNAEDAYLAAARAPNGSAAGVEAAFGAFAEAVSVWLSAAVAGWPPVAEYRAQVRRENERKWR